MKHRHHIKPKHSGGTDEAENIVILTIEEHAEAHRILYEKEGKMEDYLAWRGLTGMIGKEEIIKKIMEENGRRLGYRMLEEGRGIFREGIKYEDFYKDGISRGGKISGNRHKESGHCKRIAPLGGGKNLGKRYWYNALTGEETVAFASPGEGWKEGVNMGRVNLEFLRDNCDNAKGSFWITNESTGETRMIKDLKDLPEGYTIGRKIRIENTMNLHNVPIDSDMEGLEKIQEILSFIIFNPASMRWELMPKKNSKRIIKISHTDYYGLVWLRDLIIDKYELNHDKSIFNFSSGEDIDNSINRLKEWREWINTAKILDSKKLKKWKRDDYTKKLESLSDSYTFIESIRNKIIPAL